MKTKTEVSHTPTPWKLSKTNGYAVVQDGGYVGERTVARLVKRDEGKGE